MFWKKNTFLKPGIIIVSVIIIENHIGFELYNNRIE